MPKAHRRFRRPSDLRTFYWHMRSRLSGEPNRKGMEEQGLRLGDEVQIMGGTYIDPNFSWLVEIGSRTVVSFGVVILVHDASTRPHIGYTRIAPVRIGEDVFIGARSVILPGVTVGDGAIIAAGSVVRHDVAPGDMVAGVPAQSLRRVDEYVAMHQRALETAPKWPREGWSPVTGITEARKQEMRRVLAEVGEAYVQ